MPAGEPSDPMRVAMDRVAPLAHFETRAEAEALYQLAAGRRVLEIGTYLGFSAILMALGDAQHVDTIDPHLGGPLLPVQNTLPLAWANVLRYGVQDRITLHVGASLDVLASMRPEWWGFVFVDGDHDAALSDTIAAAGRLASGGQMAWHDVGRWADIDNAIEWAGCSGWEVRPLVDSLWVGTKP
jgi:predicted O-methyltransferase YrrM